MAAGSDKVYHQRQRGLGKAPLSDHARGTWAHFLASTRSDVGVVGVVEVVGVCQVRQQVLRLQGLGRRGRGRQMEDYGAFKEAGADKASLCFYCNWRTLRVL